MSNRPGLLSRIRARLSGGRARVGLGPDFRPDLEDEWNELGEQVDAELKKIGASVVGAWEVGAAELGRVVVGRPDDKALIERYSDALVPTLQPFQDLHKHCSTAMNEGLRAGRRDRTMAAATDPLSRLAEGLGDRAAEGWAKTSKHLEPLFAIAADPAKARARFAEGGDALRRGCASAEVVWNARLAAIPESPTLWAGLTGAAEAWQLAVTRELEIAIDGYAKGLVADIRAGRRDGLAG